MTNLKLHLHVTQIMTLFHRTIRAKELHRVINMVGVEHVGIEGGKFIIVDHASETKETTT